MEYRCSCVVQDECHDDRLSGSWDTQVSPKIPVFSDISVFMHLPGLYSNLSTSYELFVPCLHISWKSKKFRKSAGRFQNEWGFWFCRPSSRVCPIKFSYGPHKKCAQGAKPGGTKVHIPLTWTPTPFSYVVDTFCTEGVKARESWALKSHKLNPEPGHLPVWHLESPIGHIRVDNQCRTKFSACTSPLFHVSHHPISERCFLSP